MAVKLTTTSKPSGGVKVLVYGAAGVGKTVLCSTAPEPIIISAEAGLLSLADADIPVIEINTIEDLKEAFLFITNSNDAKHFQTICLDSITDIAEVMLTDLKASSKDARAAYGDMADRMGEVIRSFRDLPDRNVYFTAKVKKITDEVGVTNFVPSMPGQMLVTNLPYWFDLVLAMRIGATEDGTSYRYLQTQPDLYWEAKDRSGKLNDVEEPRLDKLFVKIKGNETKKAKPKKANKKEK